MDSKEWFQQAKFGMMVHWGLYSLPSGEWAGKRMPYIREWAQSYFRIPNAVYGELTRAFQPILFHPEEWVRLAQDAGMQYLVVTAKHHDGFALYRSKVDSYNLAEATPFGRDAIAELGEACYKHGLKFGLYYSQDLDWHDPDGGGYRIGHTNCGCMSWTNDWDYPDNIRKEYSRCFERKIKPQVEELLRHYGDLCLLWFDTPQTISPAQSRELFDLVKRYQPDCLLNSRIGNGLGDYDSCGDNEIPDHVTPGRLRESPATLNDIWGYKAFDQNWKSAEQVAGIKERLNAQGINYLLNVGPDALGRIPAPCQNILMEVGKKARV